MTVYNHPMSIPDRRGDVEDAHRNRMFWIRIMWRHRFSACLRAGTHRQAAALIPAFAGDRL